jgi:hypothetical protein
MSKLLAPVLRRGAAAVRKTAATRRYASNVATGADINHLYNGGLLTGVRHPPTLQCDMRVWGLVLGNSSTSQQQQSQVWLSTRWRQRKAAGRGKWRICRETECLRLAACGAPIFRVVTARKFRACGVFVTVAGITCQGPLALAKNPKDFQAIVITIQQLCTSSLTLPLLCSSARPTAALFPPPTLWMKPSPSCLPRK